MATIKDVALEAGVSIATVSYVLNRNRRVNRETAEKVMNAVDRLDYQPNRAAQSLVKKTSRIISVLVSNISNSFFAPIVKGIEDTANQAGYTVMVGNSDENPDKANKYISKLAQYQVDGLIISPPPRFDSVLPVVQKMDLPCVTINRRLEGTNLDLVQSDNLNGTYQAVKYLCSLGHKKIGFISGSLAVSTYADRYQGYVKALKEYDIPLNKDYILNAASIDDPESGYDPARILLGLPDRPTALFVASGIISRGAFQAVNEQGINIPSELSFIGFDETEWSPLVNPPLTTIAQKTYEMGNRAFTLLLERIAWKNSKREWYEEDIPDQPSPRIVSLMPEMIIRRSVSQIKA